MDEIISKLKTLVSDFEIAQENLLSNARQLLLSVSKYGSYTCRYSGKTIRLDQLSVDQIREIIQDYQNNFNKEKADAATEKTRNWLLRANKYSKEHPYGDD